MDEQLFIPATRILILLASALMAYWSIKSLVFRCKLRLCEFSDMSLAIVAIYWLLYSIWTIFAAANANFTPAYSVWAFNMRFGLLLTLVAFTALIKDRLLVSTMYETLMDIKEKNGSTEAEKEDGCMEL